MILLLILTILMIAVELPVTILYRREEDAYVLTAAVVELIIELAYVNMM